MRQLFGRMKIGFVSDGKFPGFRGKAVHRGPGHHAEPLFISDDDTLDLPVFRVDLQVVEPAQGSDMRIDDRDTQDFRQIDHGPAFFSSREQPKSMY